MKKKNVLLIIGVAIMISATGLLSYGFVMDSHNLAFPVPAKVMEKCSNEPSSRDVPDTSFNYHCKKNLTINNNLITRKFLDKDNGKERVLKMKVKNGKVEELFVDGKSIPNEDMEKYRPLIDETFAEVKRAEEDIREAMKDLEDLDKEELRKEIEEAMKDIEEIDMDEIRIDLEEAKSDIEEAKKEIRKELNRESIKKELEEARKDMEECEYEGMEIAIDASFKAIENIDWELIAQSIELGMEGAIQGVEIASSEAIKQGVEAGMKSIEAINFEEINKELEKELKEIEELGIE